MWGSTVVCGLCGGANSMPLLLVWFCGDGIVDDFVVSQMVRHQCWGGIVSGSCMIWGHIVSGVVSLIVSRIT